MGWPVCLIEIHGRAASYQLSMDAATGRPYGQSPASDLKQCVTKKKIGIGSPSGIFDIRLTDATDASGQTWADKIKPQDLVVIQMKRHDSNQSGEFGAGEMHTVMVGLVDSVQTRDSLSMQGIPTNEVLISGRDIGKIFTHGMVTYFTFAGASLLGAKEFGIQDTMNARPNDAVLTLIEQLFNRFMQIEWQKDGGVVKFWDVLHYTLSTHRKNYFPGGYDHQFLLGEGSFWSLLTKIASPPFHELWIDARRITDLEVVQSELDSGKTTKTSTGSGALLKGLGNDIVIKPTLIGGQPLPLFGQDRSAPTLIMRPTPFPLMTQTSRPGEPLTVDVDTSKWDELTTHVLDNKNRTPGPVQESLGVSDHEVYNTYMVYPRSPIISEHQYLMSVPPLIDLANLRRYGYRPLMPHISLFRHPASMATKDPIIKFYGTLTMQLAGWYILNDRYVSGQKTVQLMPHIHVGERLRDNSTSHPVEMMYYIESVEHTFVQNQHAKTTLGLTRGLPVTEDEQYESVLRNAASGMVAPGANVREFFINEINDGLAQPQ